MLLLKTHVGQTSESQDWKSNWASLHLGLAYEKSRSAAAQGVVGPESVGRRVSREWHTNLLRVVAEGPQRHVEAVHVACVSLTLPPATVDTLAKPFRLYSATGQCYD